MAGDDQIIYDEQGHPRQFSFSRQAAGPAASLAARTRSSSPQAAAAEFLRVNADVLGIPVEGMQSLDVRSAVAPSGENQALRFETEKRVMDTTVVSYTQTMFGLPVYQAGVAVTVDDAENAVRSASSTLHYDISAQPPGDALTHQGLNAAAVGGYDELVRKAIPAAADMRINRTRLMVYRYNKAKRIHAHPHGEGDRGFGAEPPTLPLPPVPPSIVDGKHYPAVEVLFSLPLPEWGMLNWQAFIEPDSGAVLMLRALVDGVTGMVFDRDPMTKTGNAANMPNAAGATLDLVRDNVTLVDLNGPVAGTQSLVGSLVKISEVTLPTLAGPTELTPFNFAYQSRTNKFAAVNAYYHCDRFFRLVRDLGFTLSSYFDGTAFPVPIDHRGKGTLADQGNIRNADCRGNAMNNGIGSVNFALADVGDIANPIGIAADWRVVLHELGGHGILYDHVSSANFGFSHSAGDSIAVIVNDPDSALAVPLTNPQRFTSFPWVNIGRNHGRPVNGWGWGGVNDNAGYDSEQILSTCHFRLYRSIGGDSTYQSRRQFAADSAVYLILRGIGQLTPATNPPFGPNGPLQWEQQLETADAGTWTRTSPAQTHAGGAYHKVIRWAFEKQGLFRAAGDPKTVAGKPPAVDVYIDDGRHGEYPFQPNHWSCTDIWNRRTVGAGGGVHQEPIVGQTNFAYVRIKNRGTQAATSVVVKGFHCLPGVGLEFPADWQPMATPQLSAPNLAANDSVGVVVGPFKWTPSQVGHECMFFSVSAKGDAGNIDGHVVGPIPEWRLVPHDNNLGQRNVHPVHRRLETVEWEKLPFWIRNHGRLPVLLGADIKVPAWLAQLGWKFDLPQITRERVSLKPDSNPLKVTLSMIKGKAFDVATLNDQRDRDIVVTVLHDKMPVGGMTFRVTPDAETLVSGLASLKKKTTAKKKAAKKKKVTRR
jgi:zinc metalloprotease ZmpB